MACIFYGWQCVLELEMRVLMVSWRGCPLFSVRKVILAICAVAGKVLWQQTGGPVWDCSTFWDFPVQVTTKTISKIIYLHTVMAITITFIQSFLQLWIMAFSGFECKKQQQILSASANALRILNNRSDLRVSFAQLHSQEKRATPMNFAKYRLSIQLHKIYSGNNDNDDWNDMNVQQNFNSRNEFFHINDVSNVKVGKNILCNRLTCLNGLIKLDWLNLSLIAFKLKAKSIFLTWWIDSKFQIWMTDNFSLM